MNRRALLVLLTLAHLGLFGSAFGCASSTATTAGAIPAAASAAGPSSDTAAIVYLSADDSLVIGQWVGEGETMATQEGAMLRFPDGSDVELDETTTVEVRAIARVNGPTTTRLHVQRGAVRVNVPARPTAGNTVIYQVTTPVSTVGVRGTDFAVAYQASSSATDEADIDVFEGTVEVDNGGAPERVGAGRGATVGRRAVRGRGVPEAVRERWENRRERVIERLRTRMRLNPDDDVAEKLREHLRNLPPEKRQQIQERIRRIQVEQRARARARVENVRERSSERQQTGRPVNPPPRPVRRTR